MADSNISTKNIWPYYSKANVDRAEKKTEGSELGKDQFLKILITQLKNQDPTQPLQDKEFIAQMAQFTSVEQLTNMSSEMKLLRQSLGFASGLIGKEITWSYADNEGTTHSKTGVVESITVKDHQQFAKVNGEEVALENISQIGNPAPSKEPAGGEAP
ncbi:flagellar hook assembly protein FlgD [Paenibacillus validus]|uniref:Flagellar hook assembly protein FlgD n=1 Tax=Paenibacillus validus TaxID=44253 RepID=A0A7X3CRA3_9BACL|nr:MULTISPECIES: flagellar hook assembly protein FlgD [Paenibacillus]MED4599580.1 flagellar hook assembly protein FlgD [Paenibacillus validus]MED4607114.1 flagellar hook assembly protein FlgD [Paenibacillus validus]MUG70525.1 flagellar hook assembly protein FlgD [Paenibacillus validus]